MNDYITLTKKDIDKILKVLESFDVEEDEKIILIQSRKSGIGATLQVSMKMEMNETPVEIIANITNVGEW